MQHIKYDFMFKLWSPVLFLPNQHCLYSLSTTYLTLLNQFCRFFMLLSAFLFFLEKCKNTLPQFSDEVRSSRSAVLMCPLLTMAVATAGRDSRSRSSNSFQYWPGQCVWLLRYPLASTLLCHIFIRVGESQSRSSVTVQHGFQKHLSISKHLRKLHPDHSIYFFDSEFLVVACEKGK